MSIDSDSWISLTGIIATGSEVMFDDSAIVPGMHLRWGFLPELGFPVNGFKLERRLYSGEIPVPRDWQTIAELRLPDVTQQAATGKLVEFSRASASESSGPIEYYRANVSEFIELIKKLQESGDFTSSISSSSTRPRPRISTLDLLLMASLDPYIARILGLYFIDSSVMPGSPVDYKVTGLWGATRWPRHTVFFDSIAPKSVSEGYFSVQDLKFFSSLAISVAEQDSAKALKLEGTANLSLRIVLPYPVMEVNLKFWEIVRELEWGVKIINEADEEIKSGFNVIASEKTLQIRAEQELQAFKQLEIFIKPSKIGASHLQSISYRRISGRIGDITSKIIRFNPIPQAQIPEAAQDVHVLPAIANPVKPQIETIRRTANPSMLDENGQVVTNITEAEIACRPQDKTIGIPNPAKRVRLHVAYSRTSGANSPASNILTISEPTPWAIPELIAFWRFNGTLKDKKRNIELKQHGTTNFQQFGTDHGRYIVRSEPVLTLANGGYLSTTALSELNQLGTHLYLQLWVYPSITTQAFPTTLIGNKFQQGFRLELVKEANGNRPQFWLNGGTPVASSTTIESQHWSHVAVQYDGEKIEFFINGRPAGSHNALRGRINPNNANTLYIGADPNQLLFSGWSFTGYIADVQIWRKRYPDPAIRNPNFLAGWNLNGNANELKSRQLPLIFGIARYEQDHPQHNDRQVMRLDGNTCLEINNRVDLSEPRNRITFQAWIKAEAGQSTPTLIGNNKNQSYWLGLRADGAGYRLRLQVNGQYYESEIALAAERWYYITVSLDGRYITFYINGKFSNRSVAKIARIRSNADQKICIGADSGSVAGRLRDPFRGWLADVHIWASVPSAPSPALIIDKTRTRSQQLATEPLQKKYGDLRAAWMLDGSLVDVKTGQYLAANIGSIRYEKEHPQDAQRLVLRLDGTNYLEVRGQSPTFYEFGNTLTLRAWVNPDPTPPIIVNILDPRERDRQTLTIISNDRESSFAMGLRRVFLGYRLWLFLNGRYFETTEVIPERQWSKIQVSYDGQRVMFQAWDNNGQSIFSNPESFHAALDNIRPNAMGALRIGTEVNRDNVFLEKSYRGMLADIEIWSRLPEDAEDSTNPLPEDLSELTLPADYVAHQMSDGAYQFSVQGIDLFGRVSEGSSPYPITLKNSTRPPAPGGAKAMFVPVEGVIKAVSLPLNAETRDQLTVEFTRADATRLPPNGYDIEIIRPRPRKSFEEQLPPNSSYAEIESFEIQSFSEEGKLTLKIPPFAQLRGDDVGKRFTIAYDYHLQISWTWTGTQRLFSPEVSHFKVYQKLAQQEAWVLLTTQMPDVTVPKDLIEQDPESGALAVTRVSHQEWQVLQGNNLEPPRPHGGGRWLRGRGIRWLPEPRDPADTAANKKRKSRADLLKVMLPVTTRLDSHPFLLPIQSATVDAVDTFVPGALVAYNEAPEIQGWQHYQVLWHEWNERTGWTLYIVQPQPGSQKIVDSNTPPPPTNALLLPQLRFARYYPGQRYVKELTLNEPPAFGSGRNAVGTIAYHIGISAIATRGNETLESEIGVPASVVAVNRIRPTVPTTQPEVTIDRADYYGKSRATVTWDGIGADISYQLYRSVDSAIVIRDLEQRRHSQTKNSIKQQQNPGYQGMTPGNVFDPDPDEWAFEEWLQATFNPERFTDDTRRDQYRALLANWQEALFVDKPEQLGSSDTHTPEHQAWQLATEVWEAWAERFYPALTDGEFIAIAETRGNETAFSLVNTAPIEATNYHDTINGTVTNRYLYRLRTQTKALMQSTGWGHVSAPKRAPRTRPPSAPVFTKIEAGDREITLHWALNREPELKEYRLYRSRNREDLEDLRWNPPLVATIEDPRLKVRDNALWIPDRGKEIINNLNVTEILGVYRADEYAQSTSNSNGLIILPFNYCKKPDLVRNPNSFDTLFISRSLLRIADGNVLLVLYRNQDGENQIFRFWNENKGTNYQDKNLLGLTDYYYLLIAVDDFDNHSKETSIQRTKTLEILPPSAPEAALNRTSNGKVDRVTIAFAVNNEIEILIQRKNEESSIWQTVRQWQPANIESWSEDLSPFSSVTYQIWSRTASKTVSAIPTILITFPLRVGDEL